MSNRSRPTHTARLRPVALDWTYTRSSIALVSEFSASSVVCTHHTYRRSERLCRGRREHSLFDFDKHLTLASWTLCGSGVWCDTTATTTTAAAAATRRARSRGHKIVITVAVDEKTLVDCCTQRRGVCRCCMDYTSCAVHTHTGTVHDRVRLLLKICLCLRRIRLRTVCGRGRRRILPLVTNVYRRLTGEVQG
jgi:hypothetical protein